LRHVDALADDRPGSGPIGRAERNRAKPRLACLEAGDHRIAVAHGGESTAVHVQPENPRQLGMHGVEVAVAPDRCFNDTVVALADADGCGPPVVVDRKGEIERLVGLALVGGGCEALEEPDARREGERTLRS
jgi:hypothetical protein